ncbi:hypothetical protein LXA43DRAFT_1103501 [Ganoderma leucocontextum]|nr:hypothetical protein LXA43DRAFT_1103501 [Ganoderma leucocontextum]
MSNAALILFLVYYEDTCAEGSKDSGIYNGSNLGAPSVAEAVVDLQSAGGCIIELQARSRFVAREHDLLVLRCPFKHLGDATSNAQLEHCRQLAADFSRSRTTDIVMLISTHASSNDGGLLYKPGGLVSLNEMLKHILGTMSLRMFNKSMLFVLCCGGLVRHDFQEVRDATRWFEGVFAFDAPLLDSIHICLHFVSTVLDYGVFGEESIWSSFLRATKFEVVKHADVYLAVENTVYRARDAKWRRSPNGEIIKCSVCDKEAKYGEYLERSNIIKFRCCVDGHPSNVPRNIYVNLLQEEPRKRWILGGRGQPRFMIDLV